jgi:hypothetical protein
MRQRFIGTNFPELPYGQVPACNWWEAERSALTNRHAMQNHVEMYLPSAVTKQAEIEAAIARVPRSIGPGVVRIRYGIGEDWSGQRAIFFRILLTDDAARHRVRDVATKVVWELARQLDFPDMGVFPYHNFRSVSEQSMLQEPAWAWFS